MKMLSILLFAIFVAGSNLYGRAASENILSDKSLHQSEIATSISDTVIVPIAIRTSFEKKYPNATTVVWYRYVPDKTKPDPTAWYYSMDEKDYYVSFYWDNDDYIAWYDDDRWIRSSKTVDNIELPAAVVRSVNAQYPGYRITDVDMEYDQNRSLYEVKLVKGNTKWNVHYNPDGSVFSKKERSYTPAPPNDEIISDFETRFPNATEITWYRYVPSDRVEVVPNDWDYNMDANDYEVRFTLNGSDHIVWYDNGQWVRTEVPMYDNTKLPTAVNNAINSQYSGYTINDIEQDQKANETVYEVELRRGNEKCKVHYTAMGAVVKKKCKMM